MKTSQLTLILLFVSVVTTGLSCIPVLPLRYQWVWVMHLLAIGLFIWSVIINMAAQNQIKTEQIRAGLFMSNNESSNPHIYEIDYVFVGLILIVLVTLPFGTDNHSKTDGKIFWLEYRGEFVRYVGEREYYINCANMVRTFSAVHSVMLYVTCKILGRNPFLKVNQKITECILKSITRF